MNSFRRALGTASLAAALCSCQIVDHFSSRAVDYNKQAEQAQLQPLLLNIVRASLGRPMQFTSLSSVTGSALESASGTILAPFGEATHHPRGVGGPGAADNLSLTGTISGGPTFTVPVLDTQEFYSGELQPITGSEINFFIEEGYTLPQLFYVFVNSVELSTIPPDPSQSAQHFTFQNYVGDDFDYDQFEAVADYLMKLGLTLEPKPRTLLVGPKLPPTELTNLRGVAAAQEAGLMLMPARSEEGAKARAESDAPATGDKPSGKHERPRAPPTPGFYQLQKRTVDYLPCFDSQVLQASGMTWAVDKQLICEAPTPLNEQAAAQGDLELREGFDATELSDRITQIRNERIAILRAAAARAKDPRYAQSLLHTAQSIAAMPPLPKHVKLQVKMLTRSTEGILFYLGSVVSRYLNPGSSRGGSVNGTEARMIQVKVGESFFPYPMQPCPEGGKQNPMPNQYSCDNLFVVERGTPAKDAALVVDYAGQTYWIPGNSDVAGRTMRLIDLTKQLLALHTSAKSLPASNVLNVIGGSP